MTDVPASEGSSRHRYVALLRGINVGKNNRVPMELLRDLLTGLGYTDVRTHLNSGNAVFGAARKQQPATVATKIEKALLDAVGRPIRVVVRTRDELAGVVERNPLESVATDPARFLVAFLDKPVAASRLQDLDDSALLPERFHRDERELYLWLPTGIQNSELVKTLSDQRLGVTSTHRNWNTVTRLLELADA